MQNSPELEISWDAGLLHDLVGGMLHAELSGGGRPNPILPQISFATRASDVLGKRSRHVFVEN